MHRLCVEWLDQLERQIADAGPEAEGFRAEHVRWTKAVFNYPRDWTDVHHGVVDEDALRSLRLFFAMSKMHSATVDEGRVGELRDYLEQVVTQAGAESKTGLNPAVAAMVAAAARHFLDVIDNLEEVGAVTFEEEYERFLGKMGRVMMSPRVDEDERSTFQTFMNGLVFPFITNAAGAIAGGLALQALV